MPDYMVPMATGYPVPRVDFSPLADLPNKYYQGTQNRRTLALQNAFPQGLEEFKKPNGTYDFGAMTDRLLSIGGPQAAGDMINKMYSFQLAKQFGLDQPEPTVGGGQPSQQEPRPSTVHTGPDDITRGQQQPRWTGGDNGQNTLMSLVTAKYGPDQAGVVSARYTQAYKQIYGDDIDPNEPLSPEQIQKLSGIGKGTLTSGTPASPADLPGPSPAGMVAGPGVPPQNGGQPAAQPGPAAPSASGPQAAPVGLTPQQPGPGPAPSQPGPRSEAGIPPEFSLATRKNVEQAFNLVNSKAKGAAFVSPELAKQFDQKLQQLRQQIEQIDKYRAEWFKQTPEQKTAADAGFGTDVPAYESAKAQSTELGKKFATQYSAIQGAGAGAAQIIDHTRLFRSILNSPNFYSGPGENLNLQYKKWVSVLGGDNTAVPQEAFRKIMAQNILEQVNQMKTEAASSGVPATRLFQSQIELMNKAAQNPSNTVEANRMLTEIAHRNATRMTELAEMADRYAQAHSNRLDQGFNRMRREYERQHSLFTPEEINNPSLLTAPRFDNAAQVQGARLDKRKTPVIWISPTPKHPGGYYNTP